MKFKKKTDLTGFPSDPNTSVLVRYADGSQNTTKARFAREWFKDSTSTLTHWAIPEQPAPTTQDEAYGEWLHTPAEENGKPLSQDAFDAGVAWVEAGKP